VTAKLSKILSTVLGELDGWAPDIRGALTRESEESITAILAEARANATTIAGTVPDPGWSAPHMRAFSIGGLIYVAVYQALKPRGYDAAAAWAVCDAATKAHFARMSGIQKRLAKDALFSWPIKALSRSIARRSKEAPVGGWTFDFIEGVKGELDYGVDYTRCAIRELAIANGAADFAPYICLADIAGSDTFGWGLTRTETLAQGGKRCDFRFKRGSPTDVKVRLPVTE
jgi:hypothetical protein